MSNADSVNVLELTLHGARVTYLAGRMGGRTILTFTPEFTGNADRPTLSLITSPTFPKAAELMENSWMKTQKLHPVLSNLLPKGALRDYLTQALETHTDNAFELLARLGRDLPGALIASAIEPQDIPN